MPKIMMVTPAKHLHASVIKDAQCQLEQAGFQVEIAPHAAGQHHYFSGTCKERLQDMQQALDDPSIDFILCNGGGYGTIHLVDQLDFSQYLNAPKPVIGFSDITVLHNKMQQLGLPSIHAPVSSTFKKITAEATTSLYNTLHHQPNTYHIPSHMLNRTGQAKAPVVGGNLATLCSLVGTPLELDTHNKILFIEDIDEAIYAVERMLWQLKLAGKLATLKGLIVGGMTEIKDTIIPYGQTVEEVIASMVADYDYPVCFHFPAGHIDDNRAIILGHVATLHVSNKAATFSQNAL